MLDIKKKGKGARWGCVGGEVVEVGEEGGSGSGGGRGGEDDGRGGGGGGISTR